MSNGKNNYVPDKVSSIGIREDSLNCLSFFAGAMGLDLGLEKAGINVLLACEFDNVCRQTITSNNENIGLIGDIRNYSTEEILQYAGLSNSANVNLIVGGPPCQALSTAGKRLGLNDERGNVFLKYIDIILEIQPEYAVIEHVRGLYYAKFDIDLDDEITRGFPPFLKQIEGSVLYYVMKKLEKGGYSVKFNLYNSADFGSPQKRERVVILCTRTGRPLPYLKPTHSSDSKYGLKPWRTLRHAIGKLQGTEMEYMVFPESRMKYYRILQEGQNWTNLSKEDQMSALGNSYFLSGGKTGFFRKLSWDQPSPTVVTNPAMPATDLCHPTENRPLSVEEYKEIQEFPKNWKFAGNISDKYKQIGNAVPISLGKAIGETIYRDFRREVDLPIEGFKYSRYRDTNDVDFLKALNQKVLAIKEKQLEMEF